MVINCVQKVKALKTQKDKGTKRERNLTVPPSEDTPFLFTLVKQKN